MQKTPETLLWACTFLRETNHDSCLDEPIMDSYCTRWYQANLFTCRMLLRNVSVILMAFATRCTDPLCAVCPDTCTHGCSFLPVVELLWSSPGTHFSVTFLPLRSDSTKFSGASGTSENHCNGTAFRKRKSQGHKISAARKRPGEQTFNRSQESEDVEPAASLCCPSLFSLDFNMSTTSSKKLC